MRPDWSRTPAAVEVASLSQAVTHQRDLGVPSNDDRTVRGRAGFRRGWTSALDRDRRELHPLEGRGEPLRRGDLVWRFQPVEVGRAPGDDPAMLPKRRRDPDRPGIEVTGLMEVVLVTAWTEAQAELILRVGTKGLERWSVLHREQVRPVEGGLVDGLVGRVLPGRGRSGGDLLPRDPIPIQRQGSGSPSASASRAGLRNRT